MMEYLCLSCGKDRNVLHFKSWMADKVKARRCDDCLKDPNIEARKKKSKEYNDAKKDALLTRKIQILEGYAATPTAERRREIKKMFDDLDDERRLREEIGDL